MSIASLHDEYEQPKGAAAQIKPSPEMHINEFGKLIEMREFGAVTDKWESLNIDDKIKVVLEIKKQCTGTGYTSKSNNVLDRIALYSAILGTQNGKLFFRNSNTGNAPSNTPEFESFLQKRLDEIRTLFTEQKPNPKVVKLCILRSLQIIGLATDRLFFFVNKPESEDFVRETRRQLNFWLGRFKDIVTRNIIQASHEMSVQLEESLFEIQALQSIISINFILYENGTNEVKKRVVARALTTLSGREAKAGYYEYIGEANLELSVAKNVKFEFASKEEINEVRDILLRRLSTYCTHPLSENYKILGLNLPKKASQLSDDALEIIASVLNFLDDIQTSDLIAFFHYALGDEGDWNYYENERQQGFLLIIIEKLLELLGNHRHSLSSNQIASLTRKTLHYVEKCPNGQLLQEDLSRIFLKIANTCGIACLQEHEADEIDGIDGIGGLDGIQNQHGYSVILLTNGLNALTKGIRIFEKEDRVKRFAGSFLEAIYTEYSIKNKFISDAQVTRAEKVQRGYAMLYESWLGRPSHIESLQEQQLDFVIKQLDEVATPEDVVWLALSLNDICHILTEAYHGFYRFEIRAYEKNNDYLGDVSVYKLQLLMGYELIITSPLGQSDELSSLIHSQEIQVIIKQISRYIQTSLHIFSGSEYLGLAHKFENEIPYNSQNTIAQWYRRIIEKGIESVVYVQQKAEITYNPEVSGDGIQILGGGVECLLRFHETRTGTTFGPGPYPGDGENTELGIFEAMNVLGVYKAFMFEHLRLIFSQMSLVSLPFSLNVRGDELAATSYTTNIDLLCSMFKIDPKRITIEILEEGLDFNNEQINLSIRHFIQRGMGISVDDFGSNQSSETRINGLRAIVSDYPGAKFEIKLDAIYADQLLTNFEYVKTLVSALKHTGAKICCERIENKAQLERAVEAGIDTIQGYLFHKPEPATDFANRINAI